jgi:hypothetical protein
MNINPHLDTRRHSELFKPETFKHPITIIGAGSTGSWLALSLAKLGLTDITVWDFDTIEEHNIPNQLYDLNQIGSAKVEALHNLIHISTGTQINIKNEPYAGQRLSGVVFMMIDTMEGRKKFWKQAIKMKSAIAHYIEPRMGLDVGRIYNVTPTNLDHIKRYEETLYDDDVAEVSACGTSMTVITTAMSMASMCARQLVNFHDHTPLDNEILIDFKFNNFANTRW